MSSNQKSEYDEPARAGSRDGKSGAWVHSKGQTDMERVGRSMIYRTGRQRGTVANRSGTGRYSGYTGASNRSTSTIRWAAVSKQLIRCRQYPPPASMVNPAFAL